MIYKTMLVVLLLLFPTTGLAQGFGGVPWNSTWDEISNIEGFSSLENCSPFMPHYNEEYTDELNPAYFKIVCSMKLIVNNDIQVNFFFENILDEYYLIGGRFTFIALTREFALSFMENSLFDDIGKPSAFYLNNDEIISVWERRKVVSYLTAIPVPLEGETVELSTVVILFLTDKFLELEYSGYSKLFK